jgi:hypothetical protein
MTHLRQRLQEGLRLRNFSQRSRDRIQAHDWASFLP